jgi:hypothetical protein
MEILRFDDAGSSTPQRKKSSKGMLVVGLVATLFGISSAFASSTITINSNAPVALGQGVTAVTACDTAISVTPKSAMRVGVSGPKFYLDTITVSNVDNSATDATTGLGCKDKIFDLQIFNTDSPTVTAYSCTALNYSSPKTVSITPSGDTPATCSGSTISFRVLGTIINPVFAIPFSDVLADISYFTLVSRDPTP